MRINEAGCDQCIDEVLVLFPESAELGDAQVFLIEAPSNELGIACWGGGVLVLDLDQPIAPAVGECRGLQIHTVDTEAVKLRKRRELTGDAFDDVCETDDFTASSAIGNTSISNDLVA
jgi:hypothetical protein